MCILVHSPMLLVWVMLHYFPYPVSFLGIKTEYISMMALRQSHNARFGRHVVLQTNDLGMKDAATQ